MISDPALGGGYQGYQHYTNFGFSTLNKTGKASLIIKTYKTWNLAFFIYIKNVGELRKIPSQKRNHLCGPSLARLHEQNHFWYTLKKSFLHCVSHIRVAKLPWTIWKVCSLIFELFKIFKSYKTDDFTISLGVYPVAALPGTGMEFDAQLGEDVTDSENFMTCRYSNLKRLMTFHRRNNYKETNKQNYFIS